MNNLNLETLTEQELVSVEGGGKIGDAMRAAGELLIFLSNYF
ncbi:hypothetical protein [Sphingobacterium puteale]|nr:hypothetical protein [Sphingobacterium puteale]